MKYGEIRFDLYLTQLSRVLSGATVKPDPAMWLYTNGARTPIFMLEGLARVYAGIIGKKPFKKIGIRLKALEDALGAIDYYDSFAKDFKNDPAIPASVTAYVEAKAAESCVHLNELLKSDMWIGKNVDRVSKTRKKLVKVKWLKPKDEVRAVERFYKKNIAEINDFWKRLNGEFTELETQVHSMRRKLRWLSIYPQALRGAIQLTDEHTTDANLVKYLTPEIVNSPFNKMPGRGPNRHLLLLDRGYFLALSWVIAELGRLKDEGLREGLIAEAEKAAGAVSPERSGDVDAVLSTAGKVCKTYFLEGNLDHLVADTCRAPI
jgi:hypothetical protein